MFQRPSPVPDTSKFGESIRLPATTVPVPRAHPHSEFFNVTSDGQVLSKHWNRRFFKLL